MECGIPVRFLHPQKLSTKANKQEWLKKLCFSGCYSCAHFISYRNAKVTNLLSIEIRTVVFVLNGLTFKQGLNNCAKAEFDILNGIQVVYVLGSNR